MTEKRPIILDIIARNQRAHENPSEAVLALQLFADLVERFDMLLMEVRHLQSNLIHSMRFPELHAALRFEESFIFGGAECRDEDTPGQTCQIGWSDLFAKPVFSGNQTSLSRLAEAFVPVLPLPSDEQFFQMASGDIDEGARDRAFPEFQDILSVSDVAWKDVTAPIVRALRRIQLSGQWTDSFAMNYQVFGALQTLKRNIVTDKLYHAWYGVRAFCNASLKPDTGLTGANAAPRVDGTTDRAHRADMMIVRAVAMHNLEQHVARLADYHAQFEKTLDIGSQENHRPITGRRREQGIYHNMLGERAQDMFVEISALVETLISSKDSGRTYRGMPIFIHRWQHSRASTNANLLSFARSTRINRRTRRSKDNKEDLVTHYPNFGVFAVNTSFWMPDRPDLQPVIAHEAAHCVLMELFGDLAEPMERLGVDSPLTDLWRELISTDVEWRGSKKDPSLAPDPEERTRQMREILTDVLAATVTGPGYLFALFQELIGNKPGMLGKRIGWSDWRDLHEMTELLVQGAGHKLLGMHWYVRLMVVADVVSLTLREEEKTPLTRMLIEGVTGCADALFDRYRDLRVGFDETRHQVWRDYTQALIARVRLSGALGSLARYRGAAYSLAPQSGVTGDELDISDTHRGSSARDEPLRYVNLGEQARCRLIEYLVERKACATGRALNRFLSESKETDVDYEELNALTGGDIAGQATLPHDVRYDPKIAAGAVLAFEGLYCGYDKPTYQQNIHDAQATLREPRERARKGDRQAMTALCARIPIFHRLGDIPWQTAVMRAMELQMALGASGKVEGGCIMPVLSDDYAPGREIMQLGVELWSHSRRNSHDSLAEAVRMSMNLLGFPVSDITRMPDLGDKSMLRTVLEGMISTDDAAWKRQVGAMKQAWENGSWRSASSPRIADPVLSWDKHSGPAFGERRVLTEACDAALRETIRDAAIQHIEDGLCNALTSWLGFQLDADFLELDIEQQLELGKSGGCADHLEKVVAAAIARLVEAGEDVEKIEERILQADGGVAASAGTVDLAGIAAHLADAVKQETWQRLDTNFQPLDAGGVDADTPKPKGVLHRKSVRQTVAFHQLINRTIQSLRVFEVATLSKAAKNMHDVKCSFADLDERAHDWTHVVDRVGAAGDLRALQLLKLHEGYPSLVFPLKLDALDPEAGDEPAFISVFRNDALAENGIASIDAIAHAASTIQKLFTDRLGAMTHAMLREGRAAFAANTLDQETALPVPLRTLGQQRAQRRFTALACCRLEELAALVTFDALPAMELAPLRSLLTRHFDRHPTDPEPATGENSSMSESFKALSRRTDGLSTFRTSYLSRQSLIDTHWWRETGKVDAQFRRERQHAAFYREGPHPSGAMTSAPDPERPVKAVRQFATLGRYDFFSLSNDMTFSHLRQPVMDRTLPVHAHELYSDPEASFSRIKGETTFRAFFERREHAVSLALSGDPVDLMAPSLVYQPIDQTGATGPGRRDRDVICILSMRLDRRSSRLGFLGRLRAARSHWKNYRDSGAAALRTDLSEAAQEIDLGGNPYADPGFRRGIRERLARAAAANLHAGSKQGDVAWQRYADRMATCYDGRPNGDPEQALRDLFDEAGFKSGAAVSNSQLQVAYEACRLFGDLPMLSVEASGYFLEDGDSALLGEGWGDVYLVMHTDPRPERMRDDTNESWDARLDGWLEKSSRRLYDIFALQHILFQDHEVHRTEMFLRPVAIPLAARDPVRYTISLSARSREDRELDGLVQRMVRATRQNLVNMFGDQLLQRAKVDPLIDNRELKAALHDKNPTTQQQRLLVSLLEKLVWVSHIPGRNDLEFSLADCDVVSREMSNGSHVPLSRLSPNDALDAIHELVGAAENAGGGGSEEVSTRVGFRHLLTARDGGLSFSS